MKNLNPFISILLVAILPACVKEVKPTQEAISSGQYSNAGKPAPPPSILQWQKTFGSSADDVGCSIAGNSTNDAYFIAGYTNGNNGNVSGNHGNHDEWIVKTNLDGTLLWQKAIGGTSLDEASAIVATADGGCIVAGNTQSNDGDVSGNHGGGDALLVKFDSTGIIEWKKTLGGSGYDKAWALIKTSDGGFALAGQTTSNDGDLAGIPSLNTNSKIWLVKFNNAANIEWQNTFGLNGSKDDVGYSLTQATDGEYTIAGRTLSTDNNADICVVHVNSTGGLNWVKTIGSSSGGGDVAWGVTASPTNDECVVTGYMGAYNLVAVKLDSSGNIVWQKIFAGSTSGGIQGRSILSTNQEYIITGFTSSKNGDIVASKGSEDMFVLRIDANGNKISSNVLGGSGSDMSKGVIASPDGTYVSAGHTTSNNGDVLGNHGLNDMWIVKFKF
jgi:hypothetical protein